MENFFLTQVSSVNRLTGNIMQMTEIAPVGVLQKEELLCTELWWNWSGELLTAKENSTEEPLFSFCSFGPHNKSFLCFPAFSGSKLYLISVLDLFEFNFQLFM